MPKLSILMPIYNVESYLSQALDSVCHQTLEDLEIICINDGSTDSSLDIIKKYMKEDKRIILIDKPNSGYGDSMNQGLKKAKGEYIGIVEPDDWIEPDAFEKLYALATHYQADVVKANYYTEKSSKTTIVQEVHSSEPELLLSPLPDLPRDASISPQNSPYLQVFKFSPAIWSAIYRRQFLLDHDIKFLPTPGASYQDLSFYFKVWTLAKRVVLAPSAFLHYRLDNNNSSVNSPGKVDCVVTEYQEIESFLQSHQLSQTLGPAMTEAKFRNYHWNFQRLSPELARKFYPTFRESLLVAQSNNLLKREYYSPLHWLTLQEIIKHPNLAYKILRVRSRLH